MPTETIFEGFRIGNIQRATIEVALLGDNQIIAAPGAGRRLRVVHFNFTTRGAVNVRLLSAATQLSGLYNLISGGSVSFDAAGGVWTLDMGANEAFIINLSSATGIDGFVEYFTEVV